MRTKLPFVSLVPMTAVGAFPTLTLLADFNSLVVGRARLTEILYKKHRSTLKPTRYTRNENYQNH